MSAQAERVALRLAELRKLDWQPIDTAPKDGTLIWLTWMDDGEPQEFWPMQWGHIQTNGLFPNKVGMWVAPDGGMTWNDDRGGGPDHWAPFPPSTAEKARSEGEG